MRAHLLFRDRDFEWKPVLQAVAERDARRAGRRVRGERPDRLPTLPWNADALVQDLGLETLLHAMAGDDDLAYEVARTVILGGARGTPDLAGIRYRQDVLRDCLDHPGVVREIYAIAGEAMRAEGKHYLGAFMSRYPDSVLKWSIETLEEMLASIRKLRRIVDAEGGTFASEGWTGLFASLREELADDYIAEIERHLKRLRFRNGVLFGARLGSGNKGSGYVLHRPPSHGGNWLTRRIRKGASWLFVSQPPVFGFTLAPRDEAGARALATLRNRGVAAAAGALGQSTDHVRNFFKMLRAELAFYVGCLNLHETLAGKGEPLCFPSPEAPAGHLLSFRGLYDAGLALNVNLRVVGNDADADGRGVVVVTGANQGGKSTFLRSVGLAQLMMQGGMFVPAQAFRSSVCDGLLTHFKREEDAGMESGKLDEELARMDAIVDHASPASMILFNESFAATNEREGSEIARQIVSAMSERGITLIFVTHLYELARGLHEGNRGNVLFLRADRQADGTRTFRLNEGAPLPTSFGEDLYDGIFAPPTAGPVAAP